MKMIAETTKATGPTTAMGKAVCAANALRHGLRSDRAVVPSAGETAEEWDAFRASVVLSLGPNPGAEAVLADRAASLLWRMNRVTGYETAIVNGDCVDANEPLDLAEASMVFNRSPEVELATYQQRLQGYERSIATYRAAITCLERLTTVNPEAKAAGRLDEAIATAVLECLALGCKLKREWNPEEENSDWKLWGLAEHSMDIRWDEAMLTPCAGRATAKAKVSIEVAVSAAVAVANVQIRGLDESAADLQKTIDQCRPAVTRRHSRKIGSLLLPNVETVDKIIRYEGHLGRQLTTTLQQLERLQALRAGRELTPPTAFHVTIDGPTNEPSRITGGESVR